MAQNRIKQFFADRNGNFAMTFAICLVPLMLSVGVAFDYSNVTRLRSETAQAADAAMLAAVITARDEGLLQGTEAEIAAKQQQIQSRLDEVFDAYYTANHLGGQNYAERNYTVSFNPVTKEASVVIHNNYDPFIIGAFVDGDVDVSIESSVIARGKSATPLSLFLVLDRSGSMSGSKIRDLISAVANMSLQFESIDPDHTLVRTGAVAYNHQTFAAQALDWGSLHSNQYVSQMRAGGGTDSYGAVATATNALSNPSERQEHLDQTGEEPKRFLVFMTDGNNNRGSSDTQTKTVCDNAKNNGIEIYTVAFRAPARGQQLLTYCASSADHFFDAQNGEQLNAAFQEIGAAAIESVSLSK